GEVAPEPLDDVLEVAVGRNAYVIDLASTGPRLVQKPLDPLLCRVAELAAVAVEELDPVVLGWVVRRGDDDAEVEREQRHRGGRQDAGDDRVAACLDDTAGQGRLELRPRGARVAEYEDAAAVGPERGGLAEPLDKLGRQVLPDNTPHAVGAEVASRHGGGA